MSRAHIKKIVGGLLESPSIHHKIYLKVPSGAFRYSFDCAIHCGERRAFDEDGKVVGVDFLTMDEVREDLHERCRGVGIATLSLVDVDGTTSHTFEMEK